MNLRINSDIGSMFTLGNMRQTQQNLTASLAKLSSGKRINQAADDAAGMQIANLLESQARGAGQAIRNTTEAIAVAQTADQALQQGGEILMAIREKVIQAGGAGQSMESRRAIQTEINQLVEVYNRIADTTTFNGQRVLPESVNIVVASGEEGDEVAPAGLLPGGIDVTGQEGVEAALGAIDAASGRLNTMRGEFGARQNQLVSELAGLSTTAINTWAAQSQVADVDLAEEAMIFSQLKILRQTQMFALAQGMNLNKASALDLLQGGR
ncbi:flagellin [Desulfurivibrio sp. D14AmB]|uniref:flagellin n=1 Tax=Desulfurivibrio sp. D14AmB TaxID=3374370 RepID=UPI00376F311C